MPLPCDLPPPLPKSQFQKSALKTSAKKRAPPDAPFLILGCFSMNLPGKPFFNFKGVYGWALEKLLARNLRRYRLQRPVNIISAHFKLFLHRQVNITAWIINRDSRNNSGASNAPCHSRHVGDKCCWYAGLLHFINHRCTATRTASSCGNQDSCLDAVHFKLLHDFTAHFPGLL